MAAPLRAGVSFVGVCERLWVTGRVRLGLLTPVTASLGDCCGRGSFEDGVWLGVRIRSEFGVDVRVWDVRETDGILEAGILTIYRDRWAPRQAGIDGGLGKMRLR